MVGTAEEAKLRLPPRYQMELLWAPQWMYNGFVADVPCVRASKQATYDREQGIGKHARAGIGWSTRGSFVALRGSRTLPLGVKRVAIRPGRITRSAG
jgi:hypothetical protein